MDRVIVQQFLIDKIIEAYRDGDEATQNAWVAKLAAYINRRGLNIVLVKSVNRRFRAALELYLLARTKGNIIMMDTAYTLLSAYFAVEQAIQGFTSASQYVLDAYLEKAEADSV